MGVTACFHKAKHLEQSDLNEIRKIADSLKKEDGMTEKEAVTQAINLKIADEINEYRDLYQAITDKGGTAPTPEEFKNTYLPADPIKKSTKKPGKLDAIAEDIDAEIDALGKELADLLKSQSGTLNAGVDPQVLAVGAKLGALYVAKGAVTFAQYSRAIINQMKRLGVDPDLIIPALKELYGASQMRVTDDLFDQMDDAKTVRSFDLDKLKTKLEDIGTTNGDDNVLPGNRNDQERDEGRTPGSLSGAGKSKNTGSASTGNAGSNGSSSESGNVKDSAGIKQNGRSSGSGSRNGSNGKTGQGNQSTQPVSSNPGEIPANYRITGNEGIGEGGPITKARQNIDAIRLAFELRDTQRLPTKEEQVTLSKFAGWGNTSIKNKIFPADESALNGSWADMRSDLKYRKYKSHIFILQAVKYHPIISHLS